MDVSLHEAGAADIPEITHLAEITWNQHYPSIISREQIRYMLDLMYCEKSLNEQMRDKGHRFLFIQAAENRVGFISWQQMEDGTAFIHKFYVNQDFAGKGIGTSAFKLLKTKTGKSIFRLTVNRRNITAINFYFRNGFRIERAADFDIGDGFVMEDFVMVAR